MKKRSHKAQIAVCLLAFSMACGSESVGTSAGNPLVSIDVQGTIPTSTSARMASMMPFLAGPSGRFSNAQVSSAGFTIDDLDGNSIGTLTLTEAVVAIRDIQIETEIDDDTLAENPQFEGPYVVDLLADTVTPSFPSVTLTQGIYQEVELLLHKTSADDTDDSGNALVSESDGIFGRSIYLRGTYTGQTSGGSVTNVPFTFDLDVDDELEINTSDATSTGINISGTAASIIIAFRLQEWFQFVGNDSEIDFTSLEIENNAIELTRTSSSSANESLWELIKEKIKSSADYGEDEDDDGELDEDEDHDEDEGDDEEEDE